MKHKADIEKNARDRTDFDYNDRLGKRRVARLPEQRDVRRPEERDEEGYNPPMGGQWE
jgi:hypothetical protein